MFILVHMSSAWPLPDRILNANIYLIKQMHQRTLLRVHWHIQYSNVMLSRIDKSCFRCLFHVFGFEAYFPCYSTNIWLSKYNTSSIMIVKEKQTLPYIKLAIIGCVLMDGHIFNTNIIPGFLPPVLPNGQHTYSGHWTFLIVCIYASVALFPYTVAAEAQKLSYFRSYPNRR